MQAFSETLAALQVEGKLAAHFREAWVFTACVSLARVTSVAHDALHATQLSATKGQKNVEKPAG